MEWAIAIFVFVGLFCVCVATYMKFRQYVSEQSYAKGYYDEKASDDE